MVIGDGWCILAALFSALFILRLENYANQYNAAELNGISFSTGNPILIYMLHYSYFLSSLQIYYYFLSIAILVTLFCGAWVMGDFLTKTNQMNLLDNNYDSLLWSFISNINPLLSSFQTLVCQIINISISLIINNKNIVIYVLYILYSFI